VSQPSTETIFEHPLNERVRNWLRLEEVCDRFRLLTGRESRIDHMYALLTLFDAVELVTRVDIRTDLLQELERQRLFWIAQDSNPMVSVEALQGFVATIERTTNALRQQIGRAGVHLREIEWLNSVRQRAVVPGAMCEFELPYFRLWLDGAPAQRAADLAVWFAPLAPLQDAAQWLLRLLRESSVPERLTSDGGNFQRSVVSARPPLLVRIGIPTDAHLAPEVSANRYQIGIRFFRLDASTREVSTAPVSFSLQQCVL
jgi:cell division protein ZapD